VSYATRWWRSHSVRMRLTIWYVAAMVVVLAVYAVLVFVFVRDSALDALDLRLRDDFFYFSALVDETAEGAIALPFLEVLPSQDPPSIQVWSDDGRELLLQNEIARVCGRPTRPAASSRSSAASANVRSCFRSGAPRRRCAISCASSRCSSCSACP
jgi:hypothetical protein